MGDIRKDEQRWPCLRQKRGEGGRQPGGSHGITRIFKYFPVRFLETDPGEIPLACGRSVGKFVEWNYSLSSTRQTSSLAHDARLSAPRQRREAHHRGSYSTSQASEGDPWFWHADSIRTCLSSTPHPCLPFSTLVQILILLVTTPCTRKIPCFPFYFA